MILLLLVKRWMALACHLRFWQYLSVHNTLQNTSLCADIVALPPSRLATLVKCRVSDIHNLMTINSAIVLGVIFVFSLWDGQICSCHKRTKAINISSMTVARIVHCSVISQMKSFDVHFFKHTYARYIGYSQITCT